MSIERGVAEYPRAVVWVADDPEWERYTRWCVHYCDRKDYVLVAVVEQRMGGQYHDVEGMIMDGRVEVVVVPDRSHLPSERSPRVEVVTEERLNLIEETQQEDRRPEFLRR